MENIPFILPMPPILCMAPLSPVFGALSGCLFLLLPGENRYNVLGVLDAVTHRIISVCNTSYINHLSVIELLEKIREFHKDSIIPISIFLDNAKYQVCKAVKDRADVLNIELMFLPPYSPNLNLMERLWKWMKKDCLICMYYSKF